MHDRHRLKSSRDFRRVYSRGGAAGGRRAGRLLAVHWRATDRGHVRVGYAVSTKVGGAVTRNLVKRRLRAAAGPHIEGLATGLDVVVVALPAAALATFVELDSELRSLLAPVLGL